MTIEERAEKDSNNGTYIRPGEWNISKYAYIRGAKEQQELDIEKAWELFQKYATYIHPRKGIETCVMTKYQFLEAMKGK